MNAVTSSKNIFELLDSKEKSFGNAEITSSNLINSQKSIGKPLFNIENLSCTFGKRIALKNCSILINEGSFTSFVGKSGSGKSTLAKILSGIYSEYTGSAKILGIELNQINRKSLYNFVTYVSNHDWIFSGTVRECLLEGKPTATDEQLNQALKIVNLFDFFEENGGLDFALREGAGNLSGGQKQRLSIARAILHDSPVYIFDEATSNIDVESEEIILNFIRSLKGKKTVIMISHRKENVCNSDVIYNFEGGKLI